MPPLPDVDVERLLAEVPQWRREADGEGKGIGRTWELSDFAACLAAITRIGAIAEAEGHHPDLHLTGYRTLRVVLWTHAIGGLSENDFIVAAKIDEVMP